MIPISENKKHSEEEISPLWGLAFRSFFAGGCLFSVIAIALWWAYLQGYMHIEIYGNWLWWHAHEMIFGFACAIIVGFLLTAVQTWTGIPSIKGKPLAGLFALWLSARVIMFLPVPFILVVTLDALFLLISAAVLARILFKVKMYRNIVFAFVLLALMLLNIASHFALTNNTNAALWFHAAIMLIVLIITIMGGRVIPLFTANALKIKPSPAPRIIQFGAIGSITLMIVFALLGFSSLPPWLVTLVTITGAIAHSYRLCCWFNKSILNKPILWSLHVAYSFIPLGLLLMGLQSISSGITTSLVVHSFTVGGTGGLILAMISRVTLGHTGRPLVLPKAMPAALVILFAGAFIRVLLPWANMQFYGVAIDTAALCWGVAFSIYLVCYLPALMSKRADGKPG